MVISDKRNGRLFIFDIEDMKLLHEVSVGDGAYPADQVADDLVYVSTRGLMSVRPVQVSTGTALEPIVLSHKPRSTTLHSNGKIALIGGREKAFVTAVDVEAGQVVGRFGSGSVDPRRDYGGSLACGHPAVGPDGELILLDRVARRLELYALDTPDYIDSLNLPSSPHHLHGHDGRYFVLCEGSRRSRIAPSVVDLRIEGGKMRVAQHAFLPVLDGDWAQTGGHHLTIDEERGQIYVGTASAWLYTLSTDGLRVVYRTETGPGCGHVTSCPGVGLAVTTNHTGTAMTVVDLDTGRRVRDIPVSTPAVGAAKTQGHTSYWSPSRERLYTTAAQDGTLLEIDPVAGVVTRQIVVDDADLIQGCVVGGRGDGH